MYLTRRTLDKFKYTTKNSGRKFWTAVDDTRPENLQKRTVSLTANFGEDTWQSFAAREPAKSSMYIGSNINL